MSTQTTGPLPIEGIDCLEFYVGNAWQAAYFYEHALGFTKAAYAGPETGVRDRVSYLLVQGDIRLVLTSALAAEHPIASHVLRHGDGVRDIALRVSDLDHCYHQALLRGAHGLLEPTASEDDDGLLRRAAVAVYGDTVHTFIERNAYAGPFRPGYAALDGRPAVNGTGNGVGLREVDHMVANVEAGCMDEWCDFYARVFGFRELTRFSETDISTQHSSLRSRVMQNELGNVTLPVNEPAPGRRKSQIQEFLDYYGSPGIQHIALRTDNILAAVDGMGRGGMEFVLAPPSYYDMLPERIGQIREPLDDLRAKGILADRDETGYLLQIFTRPVQDRPTLFFEIIQRNGSRSFGKGNFKALFEAIEREQAQRGNL